MKAILNFFLSKPKTYVPLLVVIITWSLGLIGVDVDLQVKESITVLCMAVAAGLIRKGMIKENELNATIEAKVEKRLDLLLDNMVLDRKGKAR